MNTPQTATEAPEPKRPRWSLRLRVSVLVLVSLLVATPAGVIVDYLSEQHVHTEGVLSSLEEQAHAISLARQGMPDPAVFARFVDEVCTHMDAHSSPGHQVLILDAGGAVLLSTPRDADADARDVLVSADASQHFLSVDGHRVAQVRLVDDDGVTVVVAQHLDSVGHLLDAQLFRRLVATGIIALVLIVLMFVVMNRWVLKPVADLARAARGWSARDYSVRSDVTGPPEAQTLARQFNKMAGELETVEREREAAMERARRIQSNLMPRTLPSIPGLSVAGTYRPTETVAGDLYDVFSLGDGRTAGVIIDVAGHGVSAALLTGVVKMSLHRRLNETRDVAKAVARVNRDLLECATEGEFVTACVGVWSPADRTWTYCAAGHPGGMLLNKGRALALPTNGALLGVMRDGAWSHSVVELDDGDRVVLYTDGVTDAGEPAEGIGEQGLITLLTESRDLPLSEQVSHVADTASTRCSAHVCDDITVLAFEVLAGDLGGDYYVI